MARLKERNSRLIGGVDPGVRAIGLCSIDGDEVKLATYRPPKTPWDQTLGGISARIYEFFGFTVLNLLIVEHMQKRPGCNVCDLMKVAVVEGLALSALNPEDYRLVTPSQWKGSVAKKIHHARIRERVEGLGRVSEHAMDALGLALWGLDNA